MAISSDQLAAPSSSVLLAASSEDRALITVDGNQQARRALVDLREGFAHWQLWLTLGWEDIRTRYRRSTIGPFWVTLSMAAVIGGIGLMYSGLFGTSGHDYVPYIAVGFIVWALITGLIRDGCASFFKAAGMIRQLPAPLSLQTYRFVWTNVIVLAHNMLIYIVICFIYGIWPGFVNLGLALLGVMIICLNGIWLGLIVGLLSSRFRDIPQIVDSVLQLAFFLTPIFWSPDRLPDRAFIIDFNPFRYYLEIVRQPLLGESTDPKAWVIVLLLTLVGSAISFLIFARYRRHVAYWV
jgi:ABC-2 type transport system permease protein